MHEDRTKPGKIIAIVGAPRSGKSFLAKRLATHYAAELFLEGEEGDFPARIEEDIEKKIRSLERILWFRTKFIKTYLRALKMKQEGRIVVLDVFWLSPQLYIDVLLEGFERELMWEIAEQDRQLLEVPDVILFLKISAEGMKKFIGQGGRAFDQSEEFLLQQALPVNEMHEKFFAQHKTMNVLTIQRDLLDFENELDFQSLIAQIEVMNASCSV